MTIVNSLYAPFNVVVVLIQVELWYTDRVNLDTETNIVKNLKYFKQSQIDIRHDCLHALIGSTDRNPKILGKGILKSMCAQANCVGYTYDFYTDDVTKTAVSLSHELGHNFGLDHDTSECACQNCIMAEIVTKVRKRAWSMCSSRDLRNLLEQESGACLHDLPIYRPSSLHRSLGGISKDYESAVWEYNNSVLRRLPIFELEIDPNLELASCGNGIIDPGEECDCGTISTCPNEMRECCDAGQCKFQPESECASGPCCEVVPLRPVDKGGPQFRCQFRAASFVCRPAGDSCDLPEFCDGKQEWCPDDYFKSDGEVCNTIEGSHSFCIRGGCREPNGWCQHLWGPSANSETSGGARLNMQKDASGAANHIANCGTMTLQSRQESFYSISAKPCANVADAECGRLWCNHNNGSLLLSNYLLQSSNKDPGSGLTYHAIIYSPTRSAEQDSSDAYWGYRATVTQDAGMVPDGTPCQRGVCYNGACINLKSLPNRKTCDCNGNGVCNNLGHCHCDSSFAPPSCITVGHGGSIDSGPASPTTGVSSMTVVLLVVLLIIFPGCCCMLYFYLCQFKGRRHNLSPPSSLHMQMSEYFDKFKINISPISIDRTRIHGISFRNFSVNKFEHNEPITSTSNISPMDKLHADRLNNLKSINPKIFDGAFANTLQSLLTEDVNRLGNKPAYLVALDAAWDNTNSETDFQKVFL